MWQSPPRAPLTFRAIPPILAPLRSNLDRLALLEHVPPLPQLDPSITSPLNFILLELFKKMQTVYEEKIGLTPDWIDEKYSHIPEFWTRLQHALGDCIKLAYQSLYVAFERKRHNKLLDLLSSQAGSLEHHITDLIARVQNIEQVRRLCESCCGSMIGHMEQAHHPRRPPPGQLQLCTGLTYQRARQLCHGSPDPNIPAGSSFANYLHFLDTLQADRYPEQFLAVETFVGEVSIDDDTKKYQKYYQQLHRRRRRIEKSISPNLYPLKAGALEEPKHVISLDTLGLKILNFFQRYDSNVGVEQQHSNTPIVLAIKLKSDPARPVLQSNHMISITRFGQSPHVSYQISDSNFGEFQIQSSEHLCEWFQGYFRIQKYDRCFAKFSFSRIDYLIPSLNTIVDELEAAERKEDKENNNINDSPIDVPAVSKKFSRLTNS